MTHDEMVTAFTGGLAPTDRVVPFAGSDRLRPDGRPRPAFRAELRRIPDLRNAGLVLVVEPGEPDDLERLVLLPAARAIGDAS